VSLRVSAKTIDQAALAALATLVLSYALIVGDSASPSAGWAWLGVAVILLVANAARLNVGARPSERGVAVGVAALALALLRITGIVAEVTLPIAASTVGASIVFPSVMRRASRVFRRF
jgi:hypothetical protein